MEARVTAREVNIIGEEAVGCGALDGLDLGRRSGLLEAKRHFLIAEAACQRIAEFIARHCLINREVVAGKIHDRLREETVGVLRLGTEAQATEVEVIGGREVIAIVLGIQTVVLEVHTPIKAQLHRLFAFGFDCEWRLLGRQLSLDRSGLGVR